MNVEGVEARMNGKAEPAWLEGFLGTMRAVPDLAKKVRELSDEIARLNSRVGQLEKELAELRSKRAPDVETVTKAVQEALKNVYGL